MTDADNDIYRAVAVSETEYIDNDIGATYQKGWWQGEVINGMYDDDKEQHLLIIRGGPILVS